jgi:hypothetical protein
LLPFKDIYGIHTIIKPFSVYVNSPFIQKIGRKNNKNEDKAQLKIFNRF